MAWSFGAAVGDRVVLTNQTINAGNGVANLHYGWYYPTNLTAGNNYFGFTTFTATWMRIAAATDELTFGLNFATTNGVWTSNDADITINNWWFIAIAWVSQNTAAADLVAWVGSPSDPPRQLAAWTNNTAPAGNPSTSPGDMRVGQDSTNTAAFIGLIDHVGLVRTNQTASATTNPMGLSSYGTINAAEEVVLYERFVKYAWAGEYGRLAKYGNSATSNNFQYWHNHASVAPSSGTAGWVPMNQVSGSGTVNPFGTVVGGGGPPAWSQTASPRPMHGPADLIYVRR